MAPTCFQMRAAYEDRERRGWVALPPPVRTLPAQAEVPDARLPKGRLSRLASVSLRASFAFMVSFGSNLGFLWRLSGKASTRGLTGQSPQFYEADQEPNV